MSAGKSAPKNSVWRFRFGVRLAATLGVAASLLLSCAAFAKRNAATLSDFEGSYTGTGVYDGQLPITASASVTVGKKGGAGTFTFSGLISDPSQGKTYPISNVLRLKSAKTISFQSSVSNLADSVDPAAGTYSFGRRSITYSAALTDFAGATVSGIISVNSRSAKPVLTMTAIVASGGVTSYSFTFALAKRGKTRK